MEKKIDSRSFRGSVVKKPYSPKALPPKRSSAVSGVQRQLPRSSHPVQYHVSQTWTQRGRLRELRFRCVARKFLYLWIRMTFGRVFPSRARFYHEQRILRKAFVEWKEEWWVSQREWKLCIRADCHYRYYLYSLVFQNWKTYVYQRQEMRSKYRRAEDHDTKQKMRRAWKSWLIYVVVRRTKHHMQTTALEFKQRSVLRVWWSKWRQRLRQARMNHTLHATAEKHRALILQLQAWSQWQEQLLRSQRCKQQVVAAVRHQQRRQKQRALEAWLRYLHIRREKRWWNEMATRFHRVTVLQTHFCDWQWAWEWRQSLSAHQALVEQLAKRMALRRVFTHWRHYMLLRAEEVAQWEAAAQHHRHSLLCFGFRALKKNVTQARLQRIRRNLAHRHQGALLLRKFWSLWQCRMEQREESQQLPSLHAAWSHYRVTLLRKCVRLWLKYMQKRRHKQLLQARAHQHFQQRALPAAFLTWRRLWHQRWQEGALDTRAVRFHRETLEKRAFAVWRQMMFQRRENRLAERMAILQAERQLLQRFWFTWRRQAAAHHQQREWQAVARVHHHHRLLWKAFYIWRERAQGFQTERMGRTQAVRLHSARLLRWAWSRWRECLALRADEQQKLLCADLHSRRAMLHRALRNWLAYQDRVRHVLQEVAARESHHQRQLLRWVLHRWRDNAVARLDEARKTSQANTHYRRTLCSKVLAQWWKVTSMQICYRQEEAAALREAQKVLERGCLRNWFRRWQYCSQRAAQQRAQLHQAAQHHRQQLLLEGMARWKAHHRECVRKRLLQRQGAQLLARRLGRAYFYQWKQQLVVRKREQQSTARALWFWAFSLQAKVWAAWLGFVLERRRKKARLDRAMQAYHRQLLQEGATRLLRFAAGTKASRQQLQAEQQVQAAHSLHCAVRRCAELWKKKALGPGGKLPTPAPTAPSRRVRFEDPLLTRLAAEAGDFSLHPPQSQGTLVGLTPSAGKPLLPDLNAVHSARKQPRCPPFLLEPVQSQRSPGCCTLRKQGLEKPLESGQDMAQPAGLPLRRPLLPGALQNTPISKPLPPASPGLEALLWPPSSWPPSSSMPRRAQAASRVSTQPTNHEYQPQACSSLARGPDPHLFVCGDFSSTGYDSEAAGNTELEAELEGILQQLQHYQTTKQNLRSCQRQANSLRRWLELSQEEPRPEDQDAEQQVQKELEEVELQIQQLAKELQAQRRPVGACIARVRALRQALCQ